MYNNIYDALSFGEVKIIIEEVNEIYKSYGIKKRMYVVMNIDKTNGELAKELNVSHNYISHLRNNDRHAIQKDCNVYYGVNAEILVSEYMNSLGIINELMPHSCNFDILVNGKIKVDVKLSRNGFIPPSLRGKQINGRHVFGIHKKTHPETDYYILVISRDMFIIPSNVMPDNKDILAMCWPTARPEIGKYQKYLNRWDLLLNDCD
jgi:hypothetical protein